MLILLFGFVLLIVFTVFVYKTANEYRRNGIGWALITFFAGIAVQIILPGFILFVIAVIATIAGSSTQEIQESVPIVTITIICILLSLGMSFLILRHLAKFPEENFDMPPAPPSDFQ